MSPENPSWSKLVAIARQAPDERPVTAPFGFSTRVVALAATGGRGSSRSLFERWSWRALAIAGIFTAATVAADYASPTYSVSYDDLFPEQPQEEAFFD